MVGKAKAVIMIGRCAKNLCLWQRLMTCCNNINKLGEYILPCEDILGSVEDFIAGFVGFVSAGYGSIAHNHTISMLDFI